MLLDQLGDERAPARLVARAEAGTGLAVEVFVEQHEVLPVRIGRKLRVAAVRRAPAAGVGDEELDQALRQIARHLP